jgi:tetratricopeptide (TPR) repeat protein
MNFQTVLELEPENADAWNDLGSVYEITNNATEAISTYGRALEVDPFHEETNFNLANIQYSLYLSYPQSIDINDIIQRLNFVLARNPNNKKVRKLLNEINSSQ